MKVFTSRQVHEIDAFTISNEPVASIDLMERAALAFVKWFMRKFDSSRKIVIFAGPGNNGGDGLAIARLLKERFYRVEVFILVFGSGLSNDFTINLDRLQSAGIKVSEIDKENQFPVIDIDCIVVDAIFGSGLNRKVSGLPASAISRINASGATVVSVDIPSGLFGEDNRDNDPSLIIRANYTLSFQFPFLSFFFEENAIFVGDWKVVPIGLHPEVINSTRASCELMDPDFIAGLFKYRSRFSHKGTYGHALIIAGCDGMMGAAVLATRACIRTGAGLVSAHVPRKTYTIIQTAAPEALISIDESDILFTGVEDLSKYSAVGAGPGLNCRSNTSKGLERLLNEVNVPLVLDADALNILANKPELIEKLPYNTIITPHPKEFDRMFGTCKSAYERFQKQLEVSKKYRIIIVLKGTYTMICLPEGISYINMTGNPGMATGGSGDVLTGMIVALLAQGYEPASAACLGVYLHGLAADLALENQSHESLIPSDIIERLGKAFKIAAANNKI